MPRNERAPHTRARILGAVTATIALLATLAFATPGGSPAVAAAKRATPAQVQGTDFRISTFNVLGYDHTAPGGNKKGHWASGTTRIKWAYQLLNRHGISLVGFQEFQKPQMKEFLKVAGKSWAIWPGESLGHPSIANNIGWRKSDWTMLAHGHIKVPYFHGSMIAMPWVRLQNRHTGRQIYLYNSHNPANVRGPAQKYRDRDVQLEIQLVRKLRAANPDIPVFITGDKNDRNNYFCPMALAGMQSANGGYGKRGKCHAPKHPSIDWILATPGVHFHNYDSVRGKLVQKTTDHHMVFSDVYVPSASATRSAVRHVVLISVDGLNASATNRSLTPTIASMMRSGASTRGARTDYDTTNAASNNLSMLTGLRQRRASGGHGFTPHAQHKLSTVTAAAHRYLSSVFGVSHDLSLNTGLVGSNRTLGIMKKSWNRKHGVPDPYQPDHGRNKINWYRHTSSDAATTAAARAMFNHPSMRFTFIEFSSPLAAAHAHGPNSAAYRAAVRAVDSDIRKIRDAIHARAGYRGHTVEIVTSSRGWDGNRAKRRPADYTVPIVVTGPGVARGTSLYGLNPQYKWPSAHSFPSYAPRRQPIRTGDLANLVSRLLGEPTIPGSQMNTGQGLTVGIY